MSSNLIQLQKGKPPLMQLKKFQLVAFQNSFQQDLNRLTPKQRRLERLSQRIKDCQYMDWAHLVCKKCGNLIKKRALKLSCLSPFCKEPDCIENKKRLVMNYLQRLQIRSKTLYHFVIGFKPVEKITKELRLEYHKILKEVIKEVEKSHPKLYLIIVGDINKSEEGLRYHYHIGSLPVKDFRLLATLLQKATKNAT
ncbi:unnamed protein product, partial [marine sediment metagenome]